MVWAQPHHNGHDVCAGQQRLEGLLRDVLVAETVLEGKVELHLFITASISGHLILSPHLISPIEPQRP